MLITRKRCDVGAQNHYAEKIARQVSLISQCSASFSFGSEYPSALAVRVLCHLFFVCAVLCCIRSAQRVDCAKCRCTSDIVHETCGARYSLMGDVVCCHSFVVGQAFAKPLLLSLFFEH